MKNTVYVAVIVVCLLVAVIVFVKTRSGGTPGYEGIPDTVKTWVICMNSSCGSSYEMGEREYYKQTEDKARASTTPVMSTPMLTCPKCGKDSIVKAVKCEKCGNVFRENSVPADFADRCPKCKYSKIEADRKARVGGQ